MFLTNDPRQVFVQSAGFSDRPCTHHKHTRHDAAKAMDAGLEMLGETGKDLFGRHGADRFIHPHPG
jgi:hypothetical protein